MKFTKEFEETQTETIKVITQILTTASGSLATRMSIPISLRSNWPSLVLWIIKLFASALSPLLVLIGALSVFAGLTTGSVSISLIGMYDVLFFTHIYRVTRLGIEK